jgi:hypothetical protein
VGAKLKRIAVPGQPEQKSSRDPISTEKKFSIAAHAYHPSSMGSINRRVIVQIGPSKKQDCISKITSAKKGWKSGSSNRVPAWEAQSPSSNPSITKNK